MILVNTDRPTEHSWLAAPRAVGLLLRTLALHIDVTVPRIRAGRLFAPSLAILLENLTTIELGLGDRYNITLWSTRR